MGDCGCRSPATTTHKGVPMCSPCYQSVAGATPEEDMQPGVPLTRKQQQLRAPYTTSGLAAYTNRSANNQEGEGY